MKTEKQMAIAAAAFAERWKGRGYERGESQPFWIDLLSNVFGIETPSDGFITFEDHQKVDASNFIDGRIPSTRVLIEQKSIGKDLRAPVKQSDGSLLNPFQQARRYVVSLPVSEHPRWIVTCNFSEFLVYDMEQPNGEPEQILLENLGKEYYRLMFLVDAKNEHLSKEMQVSMQAGEIVGRIYEALLKSLTPSPSPTGEGSKYTQEQMLHALNQLCVQIVFCLYAEDAGVFSHDQFHNYLARFEARDMRRALLNLFEVLDTPYTERDPYLEDDLAAFPYVNGGLFSNYSPLQPERSKGVRLIPQFTEELKQTLLQNASLDFDWSEISPTIFGAVFESTLNPETRRSGGMHYTSIANIHKVIDPLFLNDLRRELDEILEEKVERQRQKKLDAYQDKLAALTFLDPACGSGNFLTETYLSLRRLENEAIRERYHGQSFLGFEEVNPVKVSIQQFYGIEINDFAVTVATTALWISEAQMLRETEKIIRRDIDFLPLKSYTNIREGNALRMDWDVIEVPADIPTIFINKAYLIHDNDNPSEMTAKEPDTSYDEANVVMRHYQDGPKDETLRVSVRYDYIIGNPPFAGARLMSQEQKDDIIHVFGSNWKNVGNMDYVCGWYRRAAWLMHNNRTCKAALVSTNSICQGEQVASLWQALMEEGIRIDFAYRTFQWDSESTQKAHVHCVIVGFSLDDYSKKDCFIYDNGKTARVDHINAYLMSAPNVFVVSRPKPLCSVPPLLTGSQRIDNDEFMFTDQEKEAFIKLEPASEKYFHHWYGADEFINSRPRWVLWLGNCPPSALRAMPHCMEIISRVRDYRLASKRAQTVKAALSPNHFGLEVIPDRNFMIIPVVSSERRRYVPMGFMTPDVMCSNQVNIIPDASRYHFGVLESNVHMAWMRAVCGRLKSDYRYSKDVVYNNFPWPSPTEEQKAKIEQTAQAILGARALYPDSSLADLYDELTMPAELRKAHQDNDRAVMQAYGFNVKTMTESQCVAELFKRYQEKTK